MSGFRGAGGWTIFEPLSGRGRSLNLDWLLGELNNYYR